jgi:hypothetical protein
VISNDAHNTVDIAGTRYDARATTPLVAAVASKTTDVVTVASRVLKGARWRRTMVHVKGPEMLVVDDRITQASSRTVLQRWQLGTDRKVRVSGCGRVDTSGPGANATLLWVGGCPRLSVAVGQRSPLLGWRSPGREHVRPRPDRSRSRERARSADDDDHRAAPRRLGLVRCRTAFVEGRR